jgi:hypothetical protein
VLETLISSKTRIKLLLKFFLNSKATSYLRELESEFGESTNGIRVELNRFEKAGMLLSYTQGNKKYFRANTEHPLFQETHNILLKYIGFDQILDKIIDNIGDVQKVYVTGAFAVGIDDKIIDLVIIGNVNKEYLVNLVDKVEKLIGRKIRFAVYDRNEVSLPHENDWEKHALLLFQN